MQPVLGPVSQVDVPVLDVKPVVIVEAPAKDLVILGGWGYDGNSFLSRNYTGAASVMVPFKKKVCKNQLYYWHQTKAI